MKKMIITGLAFGLTSILFISCQDNHAAETKRSKKTSTQQKESNAPVKKDGEAVGSIETADYTFKLHQAFTYQAKDNVVMAKWKPKEGYRFVYLDVSLRNKSAVVLDGGFIFIALKVTDKNGIEYKKPAAALAAYTSDHPEAQNQVEYNELWGKFEPNEFHREIVYAVEVPENVNEFELSLPTDSKRKVWNKMQFSL